MKFRPQKFLWVLKNIVFFLKFQNMSRLQIGGPPKKFVCFPKFFFWEVGLGYVSYHQTFGYHTPNSYLCTKSPNFDIFDFCQIFVFFNHFLQGNEHFNFKLFNHKRMLLYRHRINNNNEKFKKRKKKSLFNNN